MVTHIAHGEDQLWKCYMDMTTGLDGAVKCKLLNMHGAPDAELETAIRKRRGERGALKEAVERVVASHTRFSCQRYLIPPWDEQKE